MTPHGTMLAVQEMDGGGIRFVMPTIAAPNVRIDTTIPMFRDLLGEWVDNAAPASRTSGWRLLVIQFDDRIHHDIGSVAFCRPRGRAPRVSLVPDTYFYLSRGYQSLREAAAAHALPAWQARQDIVFWRGSATHNGTAIGGAPIACLGQIPRVALCRALRGGRRTDAAIMAPWDFLFPVEQQIAYFSREEILRPATAMLRHADYRYLIDIDGVASAWSFFEKLLLGACVLKVGSPFEQWYYDQLDEWRHFVPVRADLGDLETQLDWCREHPQQACEIAAEGQRFALDHRFETARRLTLDAIDRSLLTIDE